MKAILIRHGKTAGNLEGRYIGCRTDESLCAEGRGELAGRQLPPVDRVYCSPMIRCLESASILFPNHMPIIVRDFRECDFGDFEGKNYAELNGRADYQAWIDSGGALAFPGGESRAEMERRVSAAFSGIAAQAENLTCAFVVHGGTIMAIMAAIAAPARDYFEYQISCGEGFAVEADGSWQKITAG